MAASRVVALGEVLVEFLRPSVGQPLDAPGLFEGPFVGGAPLIFAGACARLGLPTTFLGTVGADAFGRFIRRMGTHDSLDLTYMGDDPHRPTGCAFVAYTRDGGRDFVFHLRQTAAGAPDSAWPLATVLSTARWLHVCGSTLTLSEAWARMCVRAAEMARECGVRVSFDPNLRAEQLDGRSASALCAPLLRLANVILPSGEEAMLVTGEPTAERACWRLLRDGADLVVLKLGARGATAFTREGKHEAMPTAVEEVDPTGAGDVFAAALIDALLAGRVVPAATGDACVAAALAVTHRGGFDGAPTRADLDAFLRTQATNA